MSKLLSAVRPILELLEGRQLLHVPFYALVNFQPANVTPLQGTYADSGQLYGDRGNELTYGWNADNSASARVRNSSLSADKNYDTLLHMQKNGEFSWEMAVANGDYTVHIVSGDAGYTDSVYKVNVEGILTVDGTPTSANRWVEGTKTVTVTDGKLTITNASGSFNNRICFVEVSSFHAVSTVSISATQPTSVEGNT